MGRTGHLLEVEVRLRAVPSRWILQESERVADRARELPQIEHELAQQPRGLGLADQLERLAARHVHALAFVGDRHVAPAELAHGGPVALEEVDVREGVALAQAHPAHGGDRNQPVQLCVVAHGPGCDRERRRQPQQRRVSRGRAPRCRRDDPPEPDGRRDRQGQLAREPGEAEHHPGRDGDPRTRPQRPRCAECQAAAEKRGEERLRPQVVTRRDESGVQGCQQRSEEGGATAEENPRQHRGRGDHQGPGRDLDGHQGREERAVARLHLRRLALRQLDEQVGSSRDFLQVDEGREQCRLARRPARAHSVGAEDVALTSRDVNRGLRVVELVAHRSHREDPDRDGRAQQTGEQDHRDGARPPPARRRPRELRRRGIFDHLARFPPGIIPTKLKPRARPEIRW